MAEEKIPEGAEAVIARLVKANLSQFVTEEIVPLLAKNQQQTVDETVAAVMKRIQQAQAEANHSNHAREVLDQAQAESIAPVPGTVRSGTGTGIADLLPLVREGISTYFEFKNLQLREANPLVQFETLAKEQPLMARFLAQMYAPDPMEEYIPGMITKTAQRTYADGWRDGRKAVEAVRPSMRPFVSPRLSSEKAVHAHGKPGKYPNRLAELVGC